MLQSCKVQGSLIPVYSCCSDLNTVLLTFLNTSCLCCFQSQKEKEGKGANYKKYTLKDYKKLNTEVKLGGLGPSGDPEKLKVKVSCTDVVMPM